MTWKSWYAPSPDPPLEFFLLLLTIFQGLSCLLRDDSYHYLLRGEKMTSCAHHLENIATRLRPLLRVFHENLREARVSHSVWLRYVQGFQAWGAGRMVHGEFVKYDGLSGNQVLFFQALDAFLGIDRYLSDENFTRYIPAKPRELCLAFRKHSFRSKLTEPRDTKILGKIREIVRQLKV